MGFRGTDSLAVSKRLEMPTLNYASKMYTLKLERMLHAGREHPPRNEAILYPLHGNELFSANGWSLVQVFDNDIMKIIQIRVGGVLELGNSFHTSSAH
jgi:hypothetical protein